MASGRFAKQAVYFNAKLNANYSDTVIGGALTTAPAGLNTTATQFQQTLPGDRIIFSPSDALFWSNNTVGNLYSGTYRYVSMAQNSFSDPTRGHGAFWTEVTGANNSAQDSLYQVTSDEAANFGVALFAGVYVNNVNVPNANNTGNNNYWWIQESGKATVAFRNAITGTPAIGSGVYLAGAGNNNNAIDVGAFDQLAGANGTAGFNAANAYASVDAMLVRYAGPALTLPANNATGIVELTLSRAGYRW